MHITCSGSASGISPQNINDYKSNGSASIGGKNPRQRNTNNLSTKILGDVDIIRYLCTAMSRLIDHIADFLKVNGFELSFQIRHEFDVIFTRTLDGRHTKVILPLEISAETIEEAEAESAKADEAIRMITREAGYPLIITEDRWRSQRQMMEARLLAHLEVFSQAYARNCEVRRIEKAEVQEFLNKNHSYGDAACKYRYGLFLKRHTGHIAQEMRSLGYVQDGKKEAPDDNGNILYEKGLLIAVATFSNARKWIKDGQEIRSYEWTRYASLPDLRVSGGMGKMLKAFIKEVRPDDIMSYADLEWSEGEVYERLGFMAEIRKEPVTFVIDPQSWERRAIRKSPDKLGMTGNLFFRNFGSRKFRMKLTEYR